MVQSDFAVLTTVSLGTPGKAVLASAANFACANFNSVAVGVLVAAVTAGTGVELVVTALDVRCAEVVGTTLTAGGALLVATPFVELAEALRAAVVLSATVVGLVGTLTVGAIGEVVAALEAEDVDSLLVPAVGVLQPAEVMSTDATARARRCRLMILKVLGRGARVQHCGWKVSRLTFAGANGGVRCAHSMAAVRDGASVTLTACFLHQSFECSTRRSDKRRR